ncbi:MAG: ABC transporter ATP-binding protein, partial [Spirochaetales bacterium]|nr:ABC transporter ATP-binding protein [Spirochaetales bacterium]
MREALLTVKNLKTAFQVKGGEVQAVRGISFQLNRGEILGLVGESGSGKSVACFSLLRVLPENGGLTSGGIALAGQELTALSEAQMRRIRGKEISMIFQDPMTSLSPLMTVGRQIEEAYRQYHPSSSPREARLEALELLRRVHIPDPLLRYRAYPHELSGGMRQRVMIA